MSTDHSRAHRAGRERDHAQAAAPLPLRVAARLTKAPLAAEKQPQQAAEAAAIGVEAADGGAMSKSSFSSFWRSSSWLHFRHGGSGGRSRRGHSQHAFGE